MTHAQKRRPSGNSARATMLFQIALGLMASRWDGAHDVEITTGSRVGDVFKPRLSMATGLISQAHEVAAGHLDVAFLNPSSLIAQAYRGTGLFSQPLDVRVLACYPSLDSCVLAVHQDTGITSLEDLRDRKPALRFSIRRDRGHATRVLLDQALPALGMTLDDFTAWGGELVYCDSPQETERLDAIRAHAVDAVFDEGVQGWLPTALGSGFRPVPFGETFLRHVEGIGWRRTVTPKRLYPALEHDAEAVDFSGWVVYTHASLPDEDAYRVLEALADRASEVPWEDSYEGMGQLGRTTESTYIAAPLHPGAVRWYRDHGFSVD